MNNEIKRRHWLSLLNLPETDAPRLLILKGCRDLTENCNHVRQYLTDIKELHYPPVAQDMLIGRLNGVPVAYASIYGATLAAEVVHLFAELGVNRLVHIGCCHTGHPRIVPGDWFVAVEAYRGEGASQYYQPKSTVVEAALKGDEFAVLNTVPGKSVHWGRVYTTSARRADEKALSLRCLANNCWAWDTETAAVFAVANYFNIRRFAILTVADAPQIITPPDRNRIIHHNIDSRLFETAVQIAGSSDAINSKDILFDYRSIHTITGRSETNGILVKSG